MPWVIPLIGAGVGVWQTLSANKRAKEARQAMEGMKPPTANADASVSRYYNEALRKYNVAPTASWQYKNNMADINRNLTQGLSALRDRRSLIGGVSSLVGRSNDAALNAAAMAEQKKMQEFGQLGAATTAKRNDNMFRFNQNQALPYNQAFTLEGMKAAANAATVNTGIQNIYSGLSNYALMKDGMYSPPANQPPNAPASYYNLLTNPYTGTYTGK